MTATEFNKKYPVPSKFTYGGQVVATEVLAWPIKGVGYVKVTGHSNPVPISKLVPATEKHTLADLEQRLNFARAHAATIRKYLEALEKQLDL